MKRIVAFVVAAFLAFVMAGCSVSGRQAAQSTAQSADVGKEIEQFGFIFTIPQGVTGNEIDDGIYDINFGKTGQREAFIGINPPEDMAGKGGDEADLLQLQMEDMRQAVSGYFDNITNEVMEIRELDGNPAGYISMDCTIHDVSVYWQIYMVNLDNTLYSFTIQVYSDAVTEETLEIIEQFVAEIQLAEASDF